MKNQLTKLFSHLPIIARYVMKLSQSKRKVLRAWGYMHMDDFLLMSSMGVVLVREDLRQKINKLPKEQVNYRGKNGKIKIMKVAPNRKQYMNIIQEASKYPELDL